MRLFAMQLQLVGFFWFYSCDNFLRLGFKYSRLVYSLILNRVKGEEMTIAMYIGFSLGSL